MRLRTYIALRALAVVIEVLTFPLWGPLALIIMAILWTIGTLGVWCAERWDTWLRNVKADYRWRNRG
jgi:hypothetical protein